MALRVLLADESSTIKKVMQLALQDFGVEVKSVPIGVDVLAVARSFHPDIVFADVLLAKRNGYEVSGDLKGDSALKNIPVVLMWSGFMELDEAKAKQSKADRRLEKPFDADTLRNIVRDLVPNTSGNLISQFLTFPDLPPMIEDGKKAPQDQPPEIELANLSKPSPKIPSKMDIPVIEAPEDYEEPEDFQSVPLPREFNKDAAKPKTRDNAGGSINTDSWAQQDLSKFKIELPKDDDFSAGDADYTNTSIALSSGVEEIALEDIDSPNPGKNAGKNKSPAPKPTNTSNSIPTAGSKTFGGYTGTNLNSPPPSQIEDAIRSEARAVIESIAWKLLPDIVERVVREELQKLLKDTERL